MIRDNIRGFTLIELLIVIAIIAIMAASSLAIITEPMKEQARVNVSHQQVAGFATAAAQLIADAHDSEEIESGTESVTFPNRATYYIDERRFLRRVTPDDEVGAALMGEMQTLTVTPGDQANSWQIRLVSRAEICDRVIGLDQLVPLTLGSAWRGGPQ